MVRQTRGYLKQSKSIRNAQHKVETRRKRSPQEKGGQNKWAEQVFCVQSSIRHDIWKAWPISLSSVTYTVYNISSWEATKLSIGETFKITGYCGRGWKGQMKMNRCVSVCECGYFKLWFWAIGELSGTCATVVLASLTYLWPSSCAPVVQTFTPWSSCMETASFGLQMPPTKA